LKKTKNQNKINNTYWKSTAVSFNVDLHTLTRTCGTLPFTCSKRSPPQSETCILGNLSTDCHYWLGSPRHKSTKSTSSATWHTCAIPIIHKLQFNTAKETLKLTFQFNKVEGKKRKNRCLIRKCYMSLKLKI
jgi:hypothetical protein